MLDYRIILYILFLHWLGDFVLQTDKKARGKSKNWSDLLEHTLKYTLIFIFLIIPYLIIKYPRPEIQFSGWLLLFLPITFITHTIIDYYTSRVNAKLYEDNKIHEFFVAIGFDQLLHFIQLILTYYLLSNA